jgi:hypothetical protein
MRGRPGHASEYGTEAPLSICSEENFAEHSFWTNVQVLDTVTGATGKGAL